MGVRHLAGAGMARHDRGNREDDMRLVSFTKGGQAGWGALAGDGIISLGARTGFADLRAALPHLDKVKAAAQGQQADVKLADVALLPPIPNPDKIICVGLNYASHVAETKREKPVYPMLFTRYPQTFVGQGAPLVRPKVSEKFDFEGEFAFVMGKKARHVPKEKAFEYVAGYAPLNDGSIRDWQRHTIQFTPGKNFEASGSWGPALVTADEIADVGKLVLETRLNGQVMQHATLDDLIFGVPELVAYITTMLELYPGDVIATGTTGGVGAFREPPVWMKAGDKVEVEISGLGTLSNGVVDEK